MPTCLNTNNSLNIILYFTFNISFLFPLSNQSIVDGWIMLTSWFFMLSSWNYFIHYIIRFRKFEFILKKFLMIKINFIKLEKISFIKLWANLKMQNVVHVKCSPKYIGCEFKSHWRLLLYLWYMVLIRYKLHDYIWMLQWNQQQK